MKLPSSSVETTSASLVSRFVFTVDETSFLFYKATRRKEILCVGPWDCLCQQHKIPSYGKSTAGRKHLKKGVWWLESKDFPDRYTQADTNAPQILACQTCLPPGLCHGRGNCPSATASAGILPMLGPMAPAQDTGPGPTRLSVDMWACFRCL